MKFSVGQIVELSNDGHRTFDPHSQKMRVRGEVLGEDISHPGCIRVKWSNRISIEALHQDFLTAVLTDTN